MGRRRRQTHGSVGVAEELIDGLLDLSWRFPAVGLAVGAGLGAVGSYLYWINPQALFGIGGLAGLVFLLGAGMFIVVAAFGFVRHRITTERRQRRLDSTRTAESLRQLDWRQFEQLIADLLRRQGYRVKEVGGPGDGGVDLVAVGPDGGEHLVQCKQYRVWSVGEPRVREFYGAMAAHQTLCEGMIFTCGRFTEPARQFAAGKPLRLIDGDELLAMLTHSNVIAPAVSTPATLTPVGPPSREEDNSPLCPDCRTPMVRRMARRGARTGEPFWGCRNYPRCTRTIDYIIAAP
jgi:restriction system protein